MTLGNWWIVDETTWGTLLAGGRFETIARTVCLCALAITLISLQAAPLPAADPSGHGHSHQRMSSSKTQRQQVVDSLPMQRLTRSAQQRILSVTKSPTIYRRLPTQGIECDQELFLFLTRHPEVLVGIWDLMGITNVNTKRIGPYKIDAQDGSGTDCEVDLVYGDSNLHIFVADGSYDGRLVAKPIRGRGVFVLRSSYASSASGGTTVTGTIDCFVQFDNFGADLVARTLSGLIGRSADKNFVETSRFIGQISQASQKNPPTMIDVAERIPQVQPQIKKQFVNVITAVAQRHDDAQRADKQRLATQRIPAGESDQR